MPNSSNFQEFLAALPESARRHAALRKLEPILGNLDPEQSQRERVDALERLARWVSSQRGAPAIGDALPGERPELLRLRLLLLALGSSPALRGRVATTLARTLNEARGAMFLARVGLPGDRGLWPETLELLSSRLLPEPRDDEDLEQLVGRWLGQASALEWVAAMPSGLAVEMMHQLSTEDAATGRRLRLFQPMLTEALGLLAIRVSATGLSDVIRLRSQLVPLEQTPWYALLQRAIVVRDAVANANAARFAPALMELRRTLDDCRQVGGEVVANLESAGVSVDVVYRLELIESCLQRIDALADCLAQEEASAQALRCQRLLVRVLAARLHDRKLGAILGANLHLLSRKIIERAGHTGEHYITTSRGQYVGMLLSAAGGGLLTTLTAVLKFSITWLKFPLFVEATLLGFNYAGSFLLMQFLGFTLATKQPSVTAAALASTLQKTAGHPELGPLVTTIACITRSQLAAAIGNIGLVIPGALGFDFVWRILHAGTPFLDEDTAVYVVHSLDPLHTGTVFYAALTGVLLWSSSIAAGWLENFAAYRRLPEAVADHWLGRIIGRWTMGCLSRVFARNVAGIGGNVSLGVLLAATPIAGRFFGLPLDVRHVTLSAGALALAASRLGTQMGYREWLLAILGIGVIGLLNFGVSFVLALSVALRARQVTRDDRWRLLASVAATFVRSPSQFFWPPRSQAHIEVHGPVSVPPPAPRPPSSSQ